MSSPADLPEAEIYVSYRQKPDLEFDKKYYLEEHIPMVTRAWGKYGLTAWTVTQYLHNDPSGLYVQTRLRFVNIHAADSAFANMTPELRDDLKHYSNHPPEITKAEVLGSGNV